MMKQRWEDFVVREIDEGGRVVRLTSQAVPVEAGLQVRRRRGAQGFFLTISSRLFPLLRPRPLTTPWCS
jgi:hypothetical protein